MSITSSDVSNQAFSNLQFRQDQRTSDDVRARNQSVNKTVQNTLGSNSTKGEQSDSKGPLAPRKVSPSDIEQMNKSMSQLNLHLSFEVSENGRESIVKVLDQSTGHVVRQIPTEEYLKMSEQIHKVASQVSDIKGILFNGQA